MCTVCGCGDSERPSEGGHHHHKRDDISNEANPMHARSDIVGDTAQIPSSGDLLHYGRGPAHAHAPGLSQKRMVQIEQDILGKNDRYAQANRERLARSGQLCVNLVSSPGAGKTTLLTETLRSLAGKFPLAVIEGDQQTSNDAARIRETGVPAIQINTGKGCHLDAHMVGHAMEKLSLAEHGILFIENVGNLVCPAAFDLGEAHKVAILSVPEGEDKPLKYPDMFAASDLMLIHKMDLLPYVDFDLDRCIAYARQVNPKIEVLQVSARSGEGLETWIDWLQQRRQLLLASLANEFQKRLQQVSRHLNR